MIIYNDIMVFFNILNVYVLVFVREKGKQKENFQK